MLDERGVDDTHSQCRELGASPRVGGRRLALEKAQGCQDERAGALRSDELTRGIQRE